MDPLAAAVAVADVDAEPADERLAGNLGLELFGDIGFDEVSPAVRASVGEVGFEVLVHLFGQRLDPTGMSAAVIGFAAGRFGVGLGFTFAKGSGLPLTGALRLLELPGDVGNLGFELSDASCELGFDLGKTLQQVLAARTLRVHGALGSVHEQKVSKTSRERKRR